MRPKVVATAVFAAIALSVSAAGAQTTIFVATTGTDTSTCGASTAPCKTIGYGLGLTGAGDTVQVLAGTYNECVSVESGTGTGGVTLISDSYANSQTPGGATIDGTGVCDTDSGTPGPVVAVSDESTLQGFFVKNGGDSVVWGLGAAKILNNLISSGVTTSVGGGIWLSTGTYLTDPMGKAQIAGNSVSSNIADFDGAGIYVDASAGGVDSVVEITGNTIQNNTSGGAVGAYGAGIAVLTDTATLDDTSTVTITTNVITGNTAKNATAGPSTAYGGGIFVLTGATTGAGTESITVGQKGLGNTIRSNVSEGIGGGISANLQPALGAHHTIMVEGNVLTANTGSIAGGGIHGFAVGSDLDASGASSIDIRDNTLTGNQSSGDGIGGGGIFGEIYASRTPAGVLDFGILRNVVTSNFSKSLGGGASLIVYADDDPNSDGAVGAAAATIDFRNNLLALNSAIDSVSMVGRGGGVYTYAEGRGDLATATVDNDFLTVASNLSYLGVGGGAGGIEWDAAASADSIATTGHVSFALTNSIISGNDGFGVGGTLLPGPGVSVDIRYDDGFGNTSGDWESQLGVTPGDNGVLDADPGLDAVFVPAYCSVTIDAGDPAAGTLDEPQPNGGRVNLGHLGGTAAAIQTLPDVNGDGAVDGLDVLRLAVGFNAGSMDPRYDAAADLDRDGLVDGMDLSYLAAFYANACPVTARSAR
jgi:Dockerin type I domain